MRVHPSFSGLAALLGGGEFPECDCLGKQWLHLRAGQEGELWSLEQALRGRLLPCPPSNLGHADYAKAAAIPGWGWSVGGQDSTSKGYLQGTEPSLT